LRQAGPVRKLGLGQPRRQTEIPDHRADDDGTFGFFISSPDLRIIQVVPGHKLLWSLIVTPLAQRHLQGGHGGLSETQFEEKESDRRVEGIKERV